MHRSKLTLFNDLVGASGHDLRHPELMEQAPSA